MPNNCATDDHNCEVNWGSLSDDMSTGMPKWAIQWETRAWAQTEVAVSLRGMASGQLAGEMIHYCEELGKAIGGW